MSLVVDVEAGAAEGTFDLPITLEGGGAAAPVTQVEKIIIGDGQAEYGIVPGSFTLESLEQDGDPFTEAGGHPHDVSSSFVVATKFNDPALNPTGSAWIELIEAVDHVKDVVVNSPAGLIGDPTAIPTCRDTELVASQSCPPESQVGVAVFDQIAAMGKRMSAVYNMVPDGNRPAQFAFDVPVDQPVTLVPSVRSDGDWGISIKAADLNEGNPIFASTVTLWGVPAAPSHDDQRCALPNEVTRTCNGVDAQGNPGGGSYPPGAQDPAPSEAPLKPFLSMPTECAAGPELSDMHTAGWLAPAPFEADGDPLTSDSRWKSATAELAPPLTDCEALDFSPTLEARPTTNVADAPTGLEVDLSVPQNDDPDGRATAHLRKTVVTLPEGLVINPSSANGLGACSPAQIHLDDRLPDDCPDSAKIGTVEVETPLLDHALPGSVYVATPHANPFGSLLAIYVVIDDSLDSGVVGKLAGEVVPDPQTGRLTTVVDDNPQVPFEHFKVNFFGGAAAALKTPSTCGSYSTTSELTPWSAPDLAPPLTPSDTYAISQGPAGSACAESEGQLPHAPAFEAGSTSPIAGAQSPFVVNLRREDGTQRFSSITLTPPPGLVGKLAGTASCPDDALAAAAAKTGAEEKANPSCPAASEVGNVYAAAGAGPAPYNAPGKAYLAGPYKGAPLSLAVVTPATAGPYDLGTIVVRTALHLDSKTAQITATSDPIPSILQGVPLDVRSVSIRIDKPNFTLNPTSCDPTSVNGTLFSTLGSAASLQNRYQLAECGRLGFKPRLKLSLKGATKRGKYPALTAVLTPRPGDANIASVSVALPRSEFLAQGHIRTICTRVQFAADQCPAAAIYGTATVTTPLLDYPLTGPVYLRSSDNELPDLVPDLRGPAHQPIKLEAAGRTDSFKRRIRNTFEFVPDAPFSKLVLKMQGGRKGLLQNSTNLCKDKNLARVVFGAHNGNVYEAQPEVKAKCGKKTARGKKRAAR